MGLVDFIAFTEIREAMGDKITYIMNQVQSFLLV